MNREGLGRPIGHKRADSALATAPDGIRQVVIKIDRVATGTGNGGRPTRARAAAVIDPDLNVVAAAGIQIVQRHGRRG